MGSCRSIIDPEAGLAGDMEAANAEARRQSFHVGHTGASGQAANRKGQELHENGVQSSTRNSVPHLQEVSDQVEIGEVKG